MLQRVWQILQYLLPKLTRGKKINEQICSLKRFKICICCYSCSGPGVQVQNCTYCNQDPESRCENTHVCRLAYTFYELTIQYSCQFNKNLAFCDFSRCTQALMDAILVYVAHFRCAKKLSPICIRRLSSVGEIFPQTEYYNFLDFTPPANESVLYCIKVQFKIDYNTAENTQQSRK